ncbi:MAG: hypothetical protein HY094_07720 [Candidatus Melainabacteria bacterium]|nr:hypothetical protein [Candidatus Melainabacteria bacterium]
MSIKLRTAILASVIPFASGCSVCNNDNPADIKPVEVRNELPKVTHLSEVVQFKRAPESKKLFLEWSRGKQNVQNDLKNLGLDEQDRIEFALWQAQFNRKSKTFENKEIIINNLPSPVRNNDIPDLNDNDSLKKHGVMIPDIHSHNSPFVNPFMNALPNDVLKEKNYLILPVSSDSKGRRILPVAITLGDNFKFLPDSVHLSDYLDESIPTEKKSINLGLYFEVQEKGGKNRKLHAVVPLRNMPLVIEAENKMYIFAFDKIDGINEGEKKFYLPR